MANLISINEDFITEGEKRTAETLKQLPNDWTIICNKIITNNDGKTYEIDFIVIATNLIFVLDEKSWKGTIRGDENQWTLHDKQSVTTPFQKMEYAARIVKGRLEKDISVLKHAGRIVQSGVILSSIEVNPLINDPRKNTGLFLISNICEQLIKLNSADENKIVQKFSSKIINNLTSLAKRELIPTRIENYTIQDWIEIWPKILKAHANFDETEPRTLMIYDLGMDPTEKQELKSFYLQEYRALKELESTDVVPKKSDYIEWKDRFLVFPYHPVQGDSLVNFKTPTTQQELGLFFQLSSTICHALEIIHDKKVLHRNLNPGVIWLNKTTGKNPSTKIIFTDFYAARVDENTISNELDKSKIAELDNYAAPDLGIGHGFANQATDCYSLAIIFIEKITGQSARFVKETILNSDHLKECFQGWEFLPSDIMDEIIRVFEKYTENNLQDSTNTAQSMAHDMQLLVGQLANNLP